MGILNLRKVADNNTVPTPNTGYGTFFIDNNGVPRIKDDSGNILDFTSGVSQIMGQSGNLELTNFDMSQWNKNLGSVAVPNGSIYNIFDTLIAGDKTAVSSTGDGGIDIVTDVAGEDYIQMNWRGVKEYLSIRVTMEVQQGGTDFYRLQLRRKSDDSIISVHPFSINSADQPEDVVTTNINTFIGSATDDFVTGGFYIVLANNSGGTVTIANSIDILINREYQKPIASSI